MKPSILALTFLFATLAGCGSSSEGQEPTTPGEGCESRHHHDGDEASCPHHGEGCGCHHGGEGCPMQGEGGEGCGCPHGGEGCPHAEQAEGEQAEGEHVCPCRAQAAAAESSGTEPAEAAE